MINYRGPPGKKWTEAERKQLESKPHTRYTDPVTGDEMIYEIPNQETLKTKPILDINKEADRLYKKSFGNTISDKDKQLERDALQWKKYFEDNKGKISADFPKTNTMFDDALKSKPNVNTNEIKKFSKLINDR